MLTLTVIDNPLRPTERTVEQIRPCALSSLIKWRWPGGVKGTLTVVLNGERLSSDKDQRLKDEDHLLLIRVPALPAAWLPAIYAALVSMAINLVMSAIFKPKKPTALVDQPAASPVYSISGSQNAARLGEPIPVGYGSFIQVPDFASQPYVEFVENEQFLHEILVIGQGEYEVSEMMVGESSVSAFAEGVVNWSPFTSAQHLQIEGTIETATGVYENVVTSPEVGDQELSSGAPIYVPPPSYWKAISTVYEAGYGSQHFSLVPAGVSSGVPMVDQDWLLHHPNEIVGTIYSYAYAVDPDTLATSWVDVEHVAYEDPPRPDYSIIPLGTTTTPGPGVSSIGWFQTCKAGQTGDLLMFDFVLPGGLYVANATTGALESRAVSLLIEYQELNLSGAPIGSILDETVTYTYATNNVLRFTEKFTVDAGRYQVRVTRLTAPGDNLNISDKVVWTGLKFKLERKPNTWTLYGDVMLVAVKIKATNGIASAATSRIRFRCRRKLPVLGSGTPIPTDNPANTFIDIYTRTTYGAARPLSEIDMPALTACHETWSAHSGFNAVFAQKSTVFEALSTSVQVVAAAPLPVGSVMSVHVDSVKGTRVAMFTEANLTDLVVGYQFDKDGEPSGVRVEYRRPDSFSPEFVMLPEGVNEQDTETVSLFGCDDEETAEQYGQLILNRKALLRKSVSFDTELEGLILLPGDRIGVQHQMPRWGQVGIVWEVFEGVGGTPATGEEHVLLLHANGSDASTSVLDTSLNAAAMTVSGNAQIDTAQSVFGGASLLFDGTGDHVETPVHARYDIGSISVASNHTWRFRARFNSVTGTIALMAHAIPGTDGGYLLYVRDGMLGIKMGGATNASYETTAVVVGAAAWYALAFVIEAGVPHIYVDGDEKAGAFIAGEASYEDVVTLLHFNAADASTTFTCNALSPKTYTVVGNAQIDTAQSKFGGSSGLFDGVSDAIKTPHHTGFDVSTGDFTLEAWVRFNGGLGAFQTIANKTLVAAGLASFYLEANNATPAKLSFRGHNSVNLVAYAITGTTTLATGTWYHVAAVRDGNTFRLYLNGVQEGSASIAVGDSDYGSVVLLLHLDGTHGSTTFTDSSLLNKSVTPNGASALSTAQQKFGSASLALNGSNSFIVMADDDAVANFAAANATVECWAYFTAHPGSYAGDPGIMLISQGTATAATRSFEIFIAGASLTSCNVQANMWVAGVKYSASAAGQSLALNTWHFFQWVRDGATLRLGINGTQVATVAVTGLTMTNSTQTLYIGAFNDVTYRYFMPGYMDDVRITKGIARTIALPSAAFENTTSTLYLNAAHSFNVGGYDNGANALNGWLDDLRFTKGLCRYPGGTTFTPPVIPFADGSGEASFIGIDTTETSYPLRIGAGVSGVSALSGWLDEISVMDEASYTANYTPEASEFDDPTAEVPGGLSFLSLDRGLDWSIPEPHAVYLSSEVNGVSTAILCERGAEDHEVQLLSAAPFELFGRGEHQEPTRIAFGTLDTILRDWIVQSVTPSAGVGVHVEGLVYNPDVYIGAMPHQLGEGVPGEVNNWIIAGDPADPSPDTVIGGSPLTNYPDEVDPGTPDDPNAEV